MCEWSFPILTNHINFHWMTSIETHVARQHGVRRQQLIYILDDLYDKLYANHSPFHPNTKQCILPYCRPIFDSLTPCVFEKFAYWLVCQRYFLDGPANESLPNVFRSIETEFNRIRWINEMWPSVEWFFFKLQSYPGMYSNAADLYDWKYIR